MSVIQKMRSGGMACRDAGHFAAMRDAAEPSKAVQSVIVIFQEG